jgi:hypothetical protein
LVPGKCQLFLLMNKLRDPHHGINKEDCFWCKDGLFEIGTEGEMFDELSEEQKHFFKLGMQVTRDCMLASLHFCLPMSTSDMEVDDGYNSE